MLTTESTPSRILHALAGHPEVDAAAAVQPSGACTICALPVVRGMPYGKWQGANFTDQNKLLHPAGEAVCEACVWAHSWVAPPGHPPWDGARGPCLRHFSHMWSERTGYAFYSKAHKAEIRAWLLERHDATDVWWAAIADSGQKHVLPRTPINPPQAKPGWVQFEEERATLPTLDLMELIEAMYSIGATKAELATGEWRQKFLAEHLDEVRRFERAVAAHRGASSYRLAVWLAQKGEDAHGQQQRQLKFEGQG